MTKKVKVTKAKKNLNKAAEKVVNEEIENKVHFIANSCCVDGSRNTIIIELNNIYDIKKEIEIPFEKVKKGLKSILLSHGAVSPEFAEATLTDLITYIVEQHRKAVDRGSLLRLRVDKIGWFTLANGRVIFIGHNRAIETKTGIYIYDKSSSNESKEEMSVLSDSGTLSTWHDRVLLPSSEHPQFLLAMFISFASMILKFADVESSIFHVNGKTSVGKSVAATVGLSVFSNNGIENWESSKAGILSLQGAHKDIAIFLDEADTKEGSRAQKIDGIEKVAYAISSQKHGAKFDTATNGIRARSKLSSLFMSSGEFAIRSEEKSGVERGVEARLLNIPFEFDCTKFGKYFIGFKAVPNNICAQVVQATSEEYGTPFIAFVEYLEGYIDKHGEAKLKSRINKMMKDYDAYAQDAIGINVNDNFVGRISRKFGVLYAGAMLARQSGALSPLKKSQIKWTVLSAHAACIGAEKQEKLEAAVKDKKVLMRLIERIKRRELKKQIKLLNPKSSPNPEVFDKYIWSYVKRKETVRYYISKNKLLSLAGIEHDHQLHVLRRNELLHEEPSMPIKLSDGTRPRVYCIDPRQLKQFEAKTKKRKPTK